MLSVFWPRSIIPIAVTGRIRYVPCNRIPAGFSPDKFRRLSSRNALECTGTDQNSSGEKPAGIRLQGTWRNITESAGSHRVRTTWGEIIICPVWFESETLYVSVVGVRWKYSVDRIRSNSISLDSNHAGWWIFKQGWKRSLYGAWNLFDETHPHCDRKWEGDSLCLSAWWCFVPSAPTTAPSLCSVSTYVVVVV